ncbi:hypothetical protein DL766_000008 [Monosporascus sp. MC13-8B]|uniref:UBC core domain-containing protein n=1 Tax=Monosporascus cannonballus TaxID=155416 RepID=A0ABY0HJ83_9PEZI|nr:hypothetical protein DL762_000377 [Monosporascus cannonballus]RYP40207.1 hypothetical protein DL766_000008 [Monosporascus sp. MC13-8B]
MTTPLHIKRMTREREILEKENPDYFVHFQDNHLLNFEAYILGPDDTLYQHKLVKLCFKIPERYPLVSLHIFGTVDGRFLLTHAVLITIRSLLDNEPYKHEPQRDNNPAFNNFVQYMAWRCLLLDYIRRETTVPGKTFLQRHVRERAPKILDELLRQQAANSHVTQLTSPYDSRPKKPDYPGLLRDMKAAISDALSASGSTKRPLESSQAPKSLDAASDDLPQHEQKRNKKQHPGQVIDLEDTTTASSSSSAVPDKPLIGKSPNSGASSAVPNHADGKPYEVIDLT